MNIKKIIYNLFFKGKKKRSSKKSSQTRGSKPASASATSKTKAAHVKGNYDTKLLRQQVSETEYISNLRIGRSWVLPQLVQMGFKKNGASYIFDISYFEQNIRAKYDSSVAGRREIWNLMKRNYKAIAETKGKDIRARWWNKNLLISMVHWDHQMVGRRRKGMDRTECAKMDKLIRSSSDPQQIYQSIVQYDKYRMRLRHVDCKTRRCSQAMPILKNFVYAYMADGAYNAMMTMVKVYGINICDKRGRVLSRDKSIKEIEKQASILTGPELLNYCKEKFFDSGAFEYQEYVKKETFKI